MSRALVLASLVLALASAACVSYAPPHTGAVATGQPLAVVDDVRVWTTTTHDKVAETEYKDETGRTVATGAVYQDHTHVHQKQIWYPVQGPQQLSDEDFFKIANDQNSLDATLRMRDEGRAANRKGKILLGVGLGATIASYILGAATKNYTVEYVGLLGGLAASTGGWYWAYKGAALLDPDAHAVDRSQAERDAQGYNQHLGHSVGVSMSRSF
jgi:hypothetical protein